MAACDRGNNPNHGCRFEIMRKPDTADIEWIPTKLSANPRDLVFGLCIVAAKKHVRWAAHKFRPGEVRVPHRIEGFDDKRSGQSLLNQLAAGAAKTADQLGEAARDIQRICGVDDNLAFKLSRAAIWESLR